MKLSTYRDVAGEHWGFLGKSPRDGREWILSPGLLQEHIIKRAENPYSSLSLRFPTSLRGKTWPGDLTGFLEEEEAGWDRLRELERLSLVFWEKEDSLLVESSGVPVESVCLCAPLPRPRLLFGLVSNCPGPFRNQQERTLVNLVFQGHQRPSTSVVGPGEPLVVPAGAERCSYNAELGVVIGKQGKHIPIERAAEYIAGYTCITDFASNIYFCRYEDAGTPVRGSDWFGEASASWGGKKANSCCAMGPWLVSADEVGDPYDLLVYTRMSGKLRDRSSTAATMLGIERLISWYSSFATVYPGDVFHMGTMGYDGLSVFPGLRLDEADAPEVEIEKLGVLRNPLLWEKEGEKELHLPAALAGIEKEPGLSPEEWKPDRRHIHSFWTLYGNYRRAEELEGLQPLALSRFLNGPNTAVGTGLRKSINPGQEFSADLQLAAVIGKAAHHVCREDAADYLLGFITLLCLTDETMGRETAEPATPQERNVQKVYARWGDAQNLASSPPVFLPESRAACLEMVLRVETEEPAHCLEQRTSTSEYLFHFGEALSFITSSITLLPGDVITLGRVGDQIKIKSHPGAGTVRLSGEIHPLPPVTLEFCCQEENGAREEARTK